MKKNLKNRVGDFWIENNEAMPREWRSTLVSRFIEELQIEGVTMDELSAPTIKHPQLIKKSTSMRHSALDILADFIMNIDMIEERKSEYPVLNVEAELYREKKSVSIIFDEQIEYDSDAPMPPNSIYEHTFNTENPVEEALFSEKVQYSIEELREVIRQVKEDIDHYVVIYADGSDWNAENKEKKRTPENVREAILTLDETKIKMCSECGCAFYSRNARQIVCDVMRHPKYKKMTFCAYERNKRQTSDRKRKYTLPILNQTFFQL
ncbi:hypothetical protein [Aneurinibacillus sp. UBA3580]|jgi:hypothetical protein|uniref:hypothetical protein n=1 Tax=Aneurinibacillus sp. UBA3580 TaxID=1946041 RepID=UPI00257B2634|nr:hypothetical protein [Aneurinibacillus sp. UBA3580]